MIVILISWIGILTSWLFKKKGAKMIVTDRDLEHFFIEHDAINEYQTYNNLINRHSGAFFDVFDLAVSIGIELIKDPPDEELVKNVGYDKFYSMVGGMMNGNKVWINPFSSTFRQRFTLAHEIGHYLSSTTADKDDEHIMDLNTYFREPSKDIINAYTAEEISIEKNMDSFAMALIMPEYLTREYFKKTKNCYNKYRYFEIMSKLFIVSRDVAKWRLEDLELYKI